MTAEEFRALALSFDGAIESAHMNHPDFRAHGCIFATLGYPEKEWAMVKLPIEEQTILVDQHPRVFSLARGAWGLRGSTMVRLQFASADLIGAALHLAWKHSATPVSKKSRSITK